MAGAGVKAGQIYGSTTKSGKHANKDVLDVTDFNASIAGASGLIPALRRTRQVVAPLDWPTKGRARKELFG